MAQYTVGGIEGVLRNHVSDDFWTYFPDPVTAHSLLVEQDGTVLEGFDFTTFQIDNALAYLQGGRQNYVEGPGEVYDALIAAGYTLTAI